MEKGCSVNTFNYYQKKGNRSVLCKRLLFFSVVNLSFPKIQY